MNRNNEEAAVIAAVCADALLETGEVWLRIVKTVEEPHLRERPEDVMAHQATFKRLQISAIGAATDWGIDASDFGGKSLESLAVQYAELPRDAFGDLLLKNLAQRLGDRLF